MNLLEPLAHSFEHAEKVLTGVDPTRLDDPTPCTEWDLRTLLTHVVGVVTDMGHGARMEPLGAGRATVIETDVAAQFRSVADRTLAAWGKRADDDIVDIGAGPMPVVAAMSVNLLDTTTHTWDIARSTGQDAQIPTDLATTVLAVSRGFVTDEIRALAGFAAPVAVPDDASPTDQLVAFLGRQP